MAFSQALFGGRRVASKTGGSLGGRSSQARAELHVSLDLKGDTAFVTGVNGLHGAQVMATDLRASVSLVIAGLAAQGETMIGRVYHLDRGFERIEDKLGQCGQSASPASFKCAQANGMLPTAK